MRSERPIAVISGASGGIGLSTAKLFVEKGYRVYGLNRKSHECGSICYIAADITHPKTVEAALETIWQQEGRIDVLINNAGFGISGAIEFTRHEDAKKQMDVNFFGTFHCIQAVLPYMRKQKGGHIINVSSVAGMLPIPFQGFYSVSKASINCMTMALANEVRPYGIKVSALMPGDIKTNFTAAREKNMDGLEEYPAMEHSIATMEQDEQNGMRPEFIAKKLFGIACMKNPKPLYTAGIQYKIFAFLNKILPVRLVNRVIGWLYAN